MSRKSIADRRNSVIVLPRAGRRRTVNLRATELSPQAKDQRAATRLTICVSSIYIIGIIGIILNKLLLLVVIIIIIFSCYY